MTNIATTFTTFMGPNYYLRYDLLNYQEIAGFFEIIVYSFAGASSSVAFCRHQTGTHPQSMICMLTSVHKMTLGLISMCPNYSWGPCPCIIFRCDVFIQSLIKDSNNINSNNPHRFCLQFLVVWEIFNSVVARDFSSRIVVHEIHHSHIYSTIP